MASSFALGIRHSLSASSFPVLRHKAPQGWKRLEADHLKTKEVRAVAVSVDNAPKLSQVVKWQENKRIQTQILPIAADITTIRSLDWDRDRFDMYVSAFYPLSVLQEQSVSWVSKQAKLETRHNLGKKDIWNDCRRKHSLFFWETNTMLPTIDSLLHIRQTCYLLICNDWSG